MEGYLTRADRRRAHAARLPPPAAESDFSPRKLRIAAVILIGQTFATSILPFIAISLVLIPLTHQFGWSRTDFSFAQTSLFFFGSVSLLPIGRLTDIYGVRRILIGGFGLRAFTEIYSVEFMIVNIVTAFAGPLIGAIYDHTHSYRLAFELMVAAPVLSSIIWLILPRYRYAAESAHSRLPGAREPLRRGRMRHRSMHPLSLRVN